MTDTPGRSPDDLIHLTFGELRQLIALHLTQARLVMGRMAPWLDVEHYARAMAEGETPLRLDEVMETPPDDAMETADAAPSLPETPPEPSAYRTARTLLGEAPTASERRYTLGEVEALADEDGQEEARAVNLDLPDAHGLVTVLWKAKP